VITGDAIWARLSWGRMKTPFGVMDDAPTEPKEAGESVLGDLSKTLRYELMDKGESGI